MQRYCIDHLVENKICYAYPPDITGFTTLLSVTCKFSTDIAKQIRELSKTADSDTASTYQVSSVQLVTDKKLEAFNKNLVGGTEF